MSTAYGPLLKDRFGLGWSRNVKLGGVEYRVAVKPGRRVRLAYSKRFGYHWWASVYRIHRTGSGEVATIPCAKDSGARPIIEEALHREFQRNAYGKFFEDVEGVIHDRAFPRGMLRGDASPERKAWDALRAVYRDGP